MPDPLIRNHLREKLARNEVAASMTVRAFRGIEIARIAATAGFDSIYVDIEHNTLSIDTACQICMAALDAGITPLVRVPGRSLDMIGRLLDGGALGVIAPHVRTAEDAARIVACAKFPPLGERGAGGPLPHLHYRTIPPAIANAALNAATMVVIMIETVAALENVAAIAASPASSTIPSSMRPMGARSRRRGRRASMSGWAGWQGGPIWWRRS